MQDLADRLARALGSGYELGPQIASGGFGVVYRARDVRLERAVAVKTLRYELQSHGGTEVLERFAREARAMARLEHPNVMPVYAVGEGEGLVYFLMPLVEGPSLRDVLDREAPLPPGEARRILLEMARALHHAHQRGVIHRDIKPENVLLAGEERRVMVTDFGIARGLERESGTLTSSGVLLGTPHYMSPEQASGERGIDHRADLYSLGVLAFQMLAGRPPFEGSSVQAVIVKHISQPAPPLEAHRPDCPPELALAVARCLAKDPEHRFATALELCDAIAPGAASAAAVSSRIAGRLPGWISGGRVRDPVSAFRRFAAWLLALAFTLLAIDALTGTGLDFAPVAVVVLVVVLLSRYAKLWMSGYSWRDVLGRRVRADSRDTPARVTPGVPTGEGRHFGAYASGVQRVRAERALVAGLVQRMPKAERGPADRALAVADGLLAEARSMAEQLVRLDRVLAERSAHTTTTRAAAPYATHRDTVGHEARARREAALGRLAHCERVMADLRGSVEQASMAGATASRAAVDEAIVAAEVVLRVAEPRA